MRATQALLSLLAKYATFLRYCVVGVMASGVFYCVANLSALLLKQVDSMGSYFASAECVDSKEAALRLLCHTANAARNDKNNPTSKKVDSRSEAQSLESTFENAQNASKLAQNSRIFDKNAEILQNNDSTNAARRQDLGDKNGALQGESRAHTLAYVTADSPQQSPFLAPKPTPEPSQILATLLGSLASFIFGYFAQMRLAFRAYPNHSTMLPRYLALLALIAIYAQVITYLGAFFTLSYYLISAFIALSVPLFSYPLQKLWVFAETSKGGGRQLRRVGFGAKNGDCSTRAAVTYAKYAPLHALAKHHFYHPNPTASDSTPKHTQSHDSISKILESTFLYNAPTPSLRALRSKAWQSIKSTINPRIHFYKKSTSALFSTFFSPFLWLFGIAPRPSIHPLLFAHSINNPNIHTPFTAAKLMDCHAAAHAAARNDRNNAAFQSIASLEKVDSRSKAQPTHHDSKHCSGALHSIPKPKHHRRQDF